MNIKPMGERVLIKQHKKEEKTAGSIYIPDSAKEREKLQETHEKMLRNVLGNLQFLKKISC